MRIGTAGWAVPRQFADEFPNAGSNLERYAGRFRAVEINSTFHRPHKPETFARWAAAVPGDFRFAVKLPKTITHKMRLVDAAAPLQAFLEAVQLLGNSLGPLLVQLPPSLAYEVGVAASFFEALRNRFSGLVTLEPRHASWFETGPDKLLADRQIARAAADPARVPAAAVPGGWRGLEYHRLHGSPHMYRSDYEPAFLDRLSAAVALSDAPEVWCVFDNTTLGAATGNALSLLQRVASRATDREKAG